MLLRFKNCTGYLRTTTAIWFWTRFSRKEMVCCGLNLDALDFLTQNFVQRAEIWTGTFISGSAARPNWTKKRVQPSMLLTFAIFSARRQRRNEKSKATKVLSLCRFSTTTSMLWKVNWLFVPKNNFLLFFFYAFRRHGKRFLQD